MPVYRDVFHASNKLIVQYPDAKHEFPGRSAAGCLQNAEADTSVDRSLVVSRFERPTLQAAKFQEFREGKTIGVDHASERLTASIAKYKLHVAKLALELSRNAVICATVVVPFPEPLSSAS